MSTSDFNEPSITIPAKKEGIKKTGSTTMLVPLHSYSVICKTNVTAYSISIEDLIEYMPKEIKGLLIGQANKRQSWIDNRYYDIQ
jgi:hypothetical protein